MMNLLITGGTGALGRAIIEKALKSPTWNKVCIYSRCEHKQEQVREQFNNHEKLRFFIGDIRDKERLRLALFGMTHIIHAAALKIVPTAEYNPFEAIKTNILGAQNLIDCVMTGACGYPGLQISVMGISTDKAVHPINLYGATKLCAEKLFVASNNVMGNHGPRFSVARYGNVANSTGSVIPLFMRQVAAKTQLTITDNNMTRFWITLDNASQFVMQCLEAMHGGEIFVPEMPAFRIHDLALLLMEQHGYAPEDQWCMVIGIRPGEKIHEEIITEDESLYTTKLDSGVYVIAPNYQSVKPIEKGSISSNNIYPMNKETLLTELKGLGYLQ